jgi:hypothetical protein
VPSPRFRRPTTRRKRVLFFRKEPKDFYFSAASQFSGHGRQPSAGAALKVFWFFSSEKNMLFLSSSSFLQRIA